MTHRRQTIRFAISVPALFADVVNFGGVIIDLQSLADIDRMREGMLERGFSPADATRAAELVTDRVADCYALIDDRGQA